MTSLFLALLISFMPQARAYDCQIPAELTTVKGPRLVFAKASMTEAIQDVITREGFTAKDVLILASARNQADVASFPNTASPADNHLETIDALALKFPNVRLVIGVGGTKLIDVGRYLASRVKARFAGVATILTTTGLSVDRSVITIGSGTKYLKGATPVETVIHLPSIVSMPPALLNSSSAAGVGDLLAGLSAAIERGARTEKAIALNVPQDISALNWINGTFKTWTEEDLTHLACELHVEGLRVVKVNGRSARTAGEHALFNELVATNTDVAAGKPSHGLVVAVGTLIALKIFSEQTGKHSLYDQLRASYVRIGLPVTWAELSQAGLTREMLLSALHAIVRRPSASYMGTYFSNPAHDAILDRIF